VIRQPTKITKDICQIRTVHCGVVVMQVQCSVTDYGSDLCDLSYSECVKSVSVKGHISRDVASIHSGQMFIKYARRGNTFQHVKLTGNAIVPITHAPVTYYCVPVTMPWYIKRRDSVKAICGARLLGYSL